MKDVLTNPNSFDLPEDSPTSIDVDYGIKYPQRYGYNQFSKTKKAVLYGNNPPKWKWSSNNPVHFIGHSQGGNTVRLLIEMMGGTHPELHPLYFGKENQQDWIKSLATLGTPHKGTTVTDVVSVSYPSSPLLVHTAKLKRIFSLKTSWEL